MRKPVRSDLIRTRRRDLGLTQAALCAKAGLSQSFLARIERGTRQGDAETLGRVATVLGIPPAALYNATIDPTPPPDGRKKKAT